MATAREEANEGKLIEQDEIAVRPVLGDRDPASPTLSLPYW